MVPWIPSWINGTCLAGLGAGFRKGRVFLGNFKQKHMDFQNFSQNPHEIEILAKRGEGGSSNPTEFPSGSAPA